MSDPNKQAFPRSGGMPYDDGPLRKTSAGAEGMTFREYTIIEMVKVILSNPTTDIADIKYAQVANKARRMADVAIAEMA